jgi:hypothetical protein
MSRSRPLALGCTLSLALAASACSGKTEHAGGTNDRPTPPQPAVSPPGSRSAQADAARHLLMVVQLELVAHSAKTLTTRDVDLPLPRRRGPALQEPWRVEVLAADGGVLFSAPLADASALRAEFRDEKTGELKGVAAQKRIAAVTLRLPWLDGARQVRIVNVAGGDVELGRVAYPEAQP